MASRLTVAEELVRLRNELGDAKATKAGWEQAREFFRAAQAGELVRINPFELGDSLN